MDIKEYYSQDGYQKGFEDAKRTAGKIKQEKIDKYLNTETKKLSATQARYFINGWYKGFYDGVEVIKCKLATNDDFWKSNIYWENPIYKHR